jgi:type VI secretion system protein ImpM
VALGLFGKLPSQGDFVTRRLPWEFTSGWDAWLQAGLARARADLGEAWHNTYLTAPLWRFQLAPGVLGPTGWVGLWFASVDRVGRQFPLALVEPLPAGWEGRYAVLEQDEAFFTLEDAALQALDPRLGFDTFDRSLEGLSVFAPRVAAATLVPQALSLQAVSIDQVGARVLRIEPDADAMSALMLAQSAGDARCCFFTWGNEHHDPLLLRCESLSTDTEFRSFLDGRWP